jgi:integral membrane sensor domain MASE1
VTLLGVLLGTSIYWHLPFMLVVISLVYSATRFEDWDAILIEAVRWGSRMLGFMLAIAVVLFAVSWWI